MPYFSAIPLTNYDMNGIGLDFTLVTDILFRTKLIENVLNSTSSYYEYSVKDGETPEVVADKYYGDVYADWIVMYANNICDPKHDWVKPYNVFQKYLIDKYGSLAVAMTQIHHYEKVIESTDSVTGITTTRRYVIDLEDPRTDIGDVPEYDTYNDLGSLVTAYNPDYSFRNGGTVTISVYRNSVTCYDYEVAENENKRRIKLIKREYRDQIEEELKRFGGPNLLVRRYLRQSTLI